MDDAASRLRRNLEGQIDLFGSGGGKRDAGYQLSLPDIPECTPQERMMMEKETTGLYLSGHPMDAYRDVVRQMRIPPIGAVLEDFGRETGPVRFRDGQQLSLAGVVTASRTRTTKNNTLMAYVTLEDDTAGMELLCFNRCLENCGAYLRENQVIVATGKLSVRDEKAPQLMCDRADLLANVARDPTGNRERREPDRRGPQAVLYLKFPSADCPKAVHMRRVFTMFPGTVPVRIRMADTRKVYGAQVLLHDALLREAREILGEENVVVRETAAG